MKSFARLQSPLWNFCVSEVVLVGTVFATASYASAVAGSSAIFLTKLASTSIRSLLPLLVVSVA